MIRKDISPILKTRRLWARFTAWVLAWFLVIAGMQEFSAFVIWKDARQDKIDRVQATLSAEKESITSGLRRYDLSRPEHRALVDGLYKSLIGFHPTSACSTPPARRSCAPISDPTGKPAYTRRRTWGRIPVGQPCPPRCFPPRTLSASRSGEREMIQDSPISPLF
jgi:hypothetical protein